MTSFILKLWYWDHIVCYFGDNAEIMDFCQTLASKKAATCRLKNIKVTLVFHEK